MENNWEKETLNYDIDRTAALIAKYGQNLFGEKNNDSRNSK